MKRIRQFSGWALVSFAVLVLVSTSRAYAHCDGMDGPVVKAAQDALRSSNVNLVLRWVRKEDEKQIREAFAQTVEVRKLNASARELADRYFFETLVRLHRAGEGVAYTGLEPAGRDLGPAIPAADNALERRSSTEVDKLLSTAIANGVKDHFEEVLNSIPKDPDDIEAGRKYVEHYVSWVHYVNGIYEAAVRHSVHHSGHGEELGSHEE